jgi:hypothetical protein
VIEIACAIAPLCRLSFFEIIWELPAAVAWQFYYVYFQIQGFTLVRGQTHDQLLARLLLCPTKK